MRNAFADEITRLGKADPRLMLLSGDIGNKLFDKFREACPSRFVNCGIAEANMMGVAAGLALSGLRPVVYTIAPFTTTRCLEQIRVDACYNHAPVVIVGTGAGLSYAELGATHHSCEDIAILRALPGMTVFCPADPLELRAGLAKALQHDGPVYVRLGKKGEPNIHPAAPALEFGRSITVRDGRDVCLVSTGTLMPEVLRAAELLAGQGISARVESMHTVKPLDTARLDEVFAGCAVVATVEEHSRIGGLNSAVAEWLVRQPLGKARLVGFAVDDVFMHEVGTQEYARAKFGLTAENIAAETARAFRERG